MKLKKHLQKLLKENNKFSEEEFKMIELIIDELVDRDDITDAVSDVTKIVVDKLDLQIQNQINSNKKWD